MIDQILLNQSDKIEIQVSYNGVATTPTSIIIKTLTDPNAVVRGTDLAVTAGASTGRYYYQVPVAYTDTLGIYTAIWEFVINGSTYQHTQEFEVVNTIRKGYIVPEQLRDKTTITALQTATDATIQRYIDKSTVLMNAYLGDDINYSIYTEKIRCVLDKPHSGVHIQLHHKPIVSLTSVVLTGVPSSTVTLDTDLIRINENAGYLEYFYDVTYPSSLNVCVFDPTATNIIPVATVIFTAGYVCIPSEVEMAQIMLSEALYKRVNGDDKQLVSFAIGDQKEQYKSTKSVEAAIAEFGLDEASGALRLLRGYRQPMRSAGFFGPLG